jgi:hypothetical protein
MHPAIKAIYKEYGLKLVVPDPADIVWREFEQATLPETRKSMISQIIRMRVGRNGEEYLLYDETIIGKTLDGKPRENAKRRGRYEKPYFVQERNPETGNIEYTGKVERYWC